MIEIKGVSKSFGPVRVLEDIGLRVEAGEFFCLLGPSGCGKTTLLRLVAGLERPDAGSIHVGGKDVTAAPPHLRGCAMVFQSYALWPHLTVAENITYGLSVQKRPAAEIAEVLAASLETYRLQGLEARLPHQLSGGQQQRVALARAMAMNPSAVLMDEPLSNLDAALRKSLRRDLLDFHHRTGNTVVYVTHDQEEALALSDRIALLMGGRVIECGSPRELYARPAHLETALFLGDMNAFRRGRREGGRVHFGAWSAAPGPGAPAGADTLCLRPEHVVLGNLDDTVNMPDTLAGSLRYSEFLGTHSLAAFDTPAGTVLARLAPEDARQIRPGGSAGLRFPEAHRLWYREAKPGTGA
jgi:ABC-type Fe3+/spermidine/putrescine transport system ATPase subunit